MGSTLPLRDKASFNTLNDGFESEPSPTLLKPRSIPQFGTELLGQSVDQLLKLLLPFKDDIVGAPKELVNLYFQVQELDRISNELQRLVDEHRFAGRSTSSVDLPTIDGFQSHAGRLWDAVSLVGEQCASGAIRDLVIMLNKTNSPYAETSASSCPSSNRRTTSISSAPSRSRLTPCRSCKWPSLWSTSWVR